MALVCFRESDGSSSHASDGSNATSSNTSLRNGVRKVRFINFGWIFMRYPIVVVFEMPRESDSMKIFIFESVDEFRCFHCVKFDVTHGSITQQEASNDDMRQHADWAGVISHSEVLFEFCLQHWDNVVCQLKLLVVSCINHCNHWVIFKHLLKEETHACNRVELGVGTQHQKIGANRVFVCSLNWNSCNWGSFESFRLVFTFDLLKSSAGGLGSRHGGVIGISHQPTGTLIEISTGEGGGLESWVCSKLYHDNT